MTFAETFYLGVASLGIGGLFLIYVGYPVLAMLFSGSRRQSPQAVLRSTQATLIIPAWAEGEGLIQKIANTAALDLTNISLEVIVISDQERPEGLNTESLPFALSWIREHQRVGKAASINRAMQVVNTPYVVLSDANTRLSTGAMQHLLLPFQDARIGAVAGEKQVRPDHTPAADAESFYWSYESALKRSDSRLYSVIGGAGELLALRRDGVGPLPADTILDDLVLSWEVIRQGYRIAYAPDALAIESPSPDLKEEAKRKIRIAAGAYQFLDRHPLHSIFTVSRRYGFQFLFRKWARWMVAPACLLAAWLGNLGLLLVAPAEAITIALTGAQAAFYGLALIGWLLLPFRLRLGWLAAPFYFVFMHVCQLRGWLRYRLGHQSGIWERAARS